MGEKLLIVDDSSTDRFIIQSMLSDYEVLTADNGREALHQIETNPDIELIILDLNMPVMNGFQVLEELKSIDKSRRMRTIILTNYNELDKEIRGLQAGAVDYIRKPVNMESLLVRIKIHLELLKIQNLYEQTLEERDRTLNTVLDQAPIGIALSHGAQPNSNNGEQTIFNAAYERITGRTREELMELGWAQITHPDDRAKEMELYRRFQSGEIEGYSIEKRFIRPDGSSIWAQVTLAPLNRSSDTQYNHICLVQDISERMKVENALWESERSKSVLLSNLPGMAYRCDYNRQWTMQFVSEGCFELTGYHSESLIGNRDLSFNDLIAPEHQEVLWNEWTRMLTRRLPFKGEYEIVTAAGQRKWVLEMGQGVYDPKSGEIQALEGIIIDISDRKAQEVKLKQISEVDSLTGLHNRAYLESMLASDAGLHAEGMKAIVLLNLRKVNTISLTYGYNFGEKIIKELAGNLRKLANDDRELFQVSLERFAFYMKRYKDQEELKAFSRSVIDLVDGIQILRTAECGVGILEFVCAGCVAEDVIRKVSTAAERASIGQSLRHRFFDRNMEEAVERETEIKKALIDYTEGSDKAKLSLQYQPILNLKTGRVDEFEALARFRSESMGAISPGEMIPIAEESQLIVPIGKAVLEMACVFHKRLQAEGFGQIRVFVNVSAIQILRSEYETGFLDTLAKYGVAPDCIGLEITESVLVQNFNAVNEKLETLKNRGVQISIDDFGTGYSSLSREKELRVNCLKIDKVFIDRLMILKPEDSITGDIISMAHKMGHYVVAEGVEHEKQKRYLMEHGCDYLQGYLFSKPLDEDAAIRLLIQQH